MSFTAAAAARALRCRLLGPDHVVVRSADELNRARPGSLTWVKRLDADAGGRLVRLAGALVILPRSSPADASGRSLARVVARRNAVIITSRPRLACARLLRRFFSALELTAAGVNPGATVHPSARLGPGVG
ncbi:hypothetical protein FJY71_07725, partial [candidate division WOR-3 bacterium]|nr:hypothetical protein [candidate division WOR-3 bacterium]